MLFRSSVETITNRLKLNGGGTNVACGIQWAIGQGKNWKNILIISDNESWFDGMSAGYSHGYFAHGATATASAWASYKRGVPGAKLVCWNIQPGTSTQAKNDKTVLNVGGFTESVYDLVDVWFSGKTEDDWRRLIKTIPVR